MKFFIGIILIAVQSKGGGIRFLIVCNPKLRFVRITLYVNVHLFGAVIRKKMYAILCQFFIVKAKYRHFGVGYYCCEVRDTKIQKTLQFVK
jgi:hypothetical protein